MLKTDAGLYLVEVDGLKYEFEKFGAEESLDMLLDISSVVGGPLGDALAKMFSKTGEGLDTEINPQMIAGIFEGLSKNLKKDVVKPLIRKLTSDRVMCNGKKINFNEHYKEDLLHMFRVAKAALEVQYGNFFAASKGSAVREVVQAVTNRA